MTLRGLRLATYWRMAATGCMIASSAYACAAVAGEAPKIEVGEPEGFANIAGERTLMVDIYYGGTRLGETIIKVMPGSVRFTDVQDVIGLLPISENSDVVANLLGGHELPSNTALACSRTADSKTCGRMAPELLGVIFDPDKFRIDVFLNPQFVSAQAKRAPEFLSLTDDEPSLINSIGAVFSGQIGARKKHAGVFNQLILAQGERRLRADVAYNTGTGFEADRVVMEWDRPGLRYSAGALWAPGNELQARRKFFGGGIQSQIDTRLDKDYITSSPIVCYLDQRARVDVLRDGRLLSSGVYQAGNQQIDTSNLPDGSYDITLRIEEPGRAPREERRFFTKSNQIPSLGRADFLLFGGVPLADSRNPSTESSSGGFVHGELAFRADRNLAFVGIVELAQQKISSEFGATFLSPFAQVRASAIADTEGAVGGILQFASTGTSRLNFNLDLRRVLQDEGRVSRGSWGLIETGIDDEMQRTGPSIRGSYSQLGALVSYNLNSVRFLGTGYYRQDSRVDPQYSIGPSLEWDVLRRGRLTLTVRGDVSLTDRGDSGFAGISLRMLGHRTTYSTLAGAHTSNVDDSNRGDGPVAAVAGSWASSTTNGDVSLGAGLEHQPERETAFVSGDLRHRGGAISIDVAHTDVRGPDNTQYSVGFQTTVAVGAGDFRIAGKTSSESLMVAKVSGASAKDTFEVLVNEQPMGSIVGANALTIALPSYRSYNVRIRPTGEALRAYDSASRAVALYPGAVANVQWEATPITIKIGRLVTAEGEPVAGALLTARGVWAETDADGRFQIEAPDNVELAVSLGDETSLTSFLPAGRLTSGVFHVGTIVCCTREPNKGLAVASSFEDGD